MSDRAQVLVHGATGLTGRLVCRALVKRGVSFDISGRNREKLDALARELRSGGRTPLVHVVDALSRESLAPALEGRRVVAACAGPFADIGEPLLALAAERGLRYVDTSGEQSFVARALSHDSAAERSGACVAPSMAYEVAVADWLAARATARLDGAVESIAVCYSHGIDFAANVSRGTLLSSLGELGGDDAGASRGGRAWVDGVLRREEPMRHTRRFAVIGADGSRRELVGVSFPSPEPLLLPSHTGARTVRTFLALPKLVADGLVAARTLLPLLARASRLAATRHEPHDRSPTAFEVIVEASRGGVSALARARGKDPYTVTAEIQAFAITEALAGRMVAKGVVAPSVACDGGRGLAALEACGVTVEITERSRER